MSRHAIKPYHRASKSAKELILAMNRMGFDVERWNPYRQYHTVINWGSREPITNAYKVINQPIKVKNSSNKLYTFMKLLEGGITVPRVTTNSDVAKSFHGKVYGRSNNLSGGRGITVYETPSEIRSGHDFYTQRVESVRELRVHVANEDYQGFMGGKCGLISWSEKKPREYGTYNCDIRNYSKGYYFSLRDKDRIPERLLSMCKKSLKALELDFCSFDILETIHGEYVFLESNTASGIQGTTLKEYAKFLGGNL